MIDENLLHLGMIYDEKGLRILLTLLVLGAFISSPGIYAQGEENGLTGDRLIDSVYQAENLGMQRDHAGRWNLNTSVGTSVSFIPGHGAGSSFFAAPHLDFSATNRLTLHSGFIASQGLPLYTAFGTESNTLHSFTGLSAFVAASYRLTEDLVFFGSGMKRMLHSDMSGINSAAWMDDISFGAAYSIGNFTIGASFHSGPSNRFNRSPFDTGPGFYPSPSTNHIW